LRNPIKQKQHPGFFGPGAVLSIAIFYFQGTTSCDSESFVDKYTLPILLSGLTSKFRLPPWNTMMVAALYSATPCILLFIFCQRYFVEGIVTTGIKE